MSLVMIKVLVLQVIGLLLLGSLQFSHATVQRHTFVVEDTPYTRLCSSKKILTVNGSLPGPTLFANRGDTIIVNVINNGTENITIHWHGVKQPRYPWSDGPEFITQCPIQPGANFSQKILLSDEEGTLWWHAHSDWSRATVYGQIVVYPPNGTNNGYPFPKPQAEVPIILGEWWKSDIQEVLNEFLASGGDPNISDAFLINGQPGDLYDCSKNGTFRFTVDSGKTYLLRMVNAVMNNIMFFSIANHNLTVVGTDGAYTKPFQAPVVVISPGQTLDLLLHADQPPNHYYMAAKALNTASSVRYDNTTTTAFVQYSGNYTPSPSPPFPNLPDHNNITASVGFTSQLRSLADKNHPINVPRNVSTNLFFTISINTRPCENNASNCTGPRGGMFAASVNNNSYILPQTNILQAYYNSTIVNNTVNDIYATDFPAFPPLKFDYTNATLPTELQLPERNKTAKVFVLEYGTEVELVYQGTNLVAGIDHPMHLHGYSFYVVGWGFGNFDKDKDPQNYNLVDPPLMNTIALPKNAWTAIRFKADNPGVWFMHCHLERHTSWGMEMTFIVKNGTGVNETMLPPPSDMPKCL